ncbi:MAG: RidA family protein [Syntrophomonas sp.]|nr:RidA family protein [Syntrophomonas sp.]
MLKKVHTHKAPDAIGPYTQAIIAQGFVFTSGQIAINPDTNSVAGATIEEQTEQVICNLKEILREAGTTLDNVVKTTCFLADMNDFAAFNNVYGQHFSGNPARSCVAVKQLPKNVLVEVEVIASL